MRNLGRDRFRMWKRLVFNTIRVPAAIMQLIQPSFNSVSGVAWNVGRSFSEEYSFGSLPGYFERSAKNVKFMGYLFGIINYIYHARIGIVPKPGQFLSICYHLLVLLICISRILLLSIICRPIASVKCFFLHFYANFISSTPMVEVC